MLAAFALLAMAARALVPAGYMFAPGDDGRFVAVVLCSAHGDSTLLLDTQTGELVDADQQSPSSKPAGADTPCVFAALATLAAPDAPTSLAAPLSVAFAESKAQAALIPGRGLAAPPPWATGPPLNA